MVNGVGMKDSKANFTTTAGKGDGGGNNDRPPTGGPPNGPERNIPPSFAKFWESHAHDAAERLTSHAGPARDAETRAIVEELKQTAKISPERVLDAVWDAGGRAVWLEIGKHDVATRKGDGMLHILHQHRDHFSKPSEFTSETGVRRPAIAEGDIKGAVMEAVKGEDNGVYVYVGDNGYIVGARPKNRRD